MENLLHILKLIKPTNVKTSKIAIHFPTYTHRQTHADTETRIGKYSEQQSSSSHCKPLEEEEEAEEIGAPAKMVEEHGSIYALLTSKQ